MADVPDAIERELILPVPPERVWSALTQPQHLSAWFGTRALVDLRLGGAVSFIWDDAPNRGSHTNTGIIEALDPPRRFAFRWQSGAPDDPMTLVEFTLDEHPQGTRLRVVESGFRRLRAEHHASNVRGWQRELEELRTYLVDAPGQRP